MIVVWQTQWRIGDQGYKVFEDAWSNVVDLRNTLTAKPGELADYEELLKKALMLYNRGEAASMKNRAMARKFHAKAQAAFEKALLRLEEMMEQDPSLQMWLDRHCDFTPNGDLSLDPVGMPRAITSRSPDNLSGGVAKRIKRWWVVNGDGTAQLTVRYGSKPIELVKGKNAIACTDMAEIGSILTQVKAAVLNGELDKALEGVTVAGRRAKQSS